MAEFTETPFTEKVVTTPCCGTEHTLRHTPFKHRGYPRKADSQVEVWNFRCDGCGQDARVMFLLRLERENPEQTGWSTYGYLTGGPVWFDGAGEVIR